MRLSLDTKEEVWFQYLLEDTLEDSQQCLFDQACQKFLGKIFEMTVESLQQRTKDDVSFEFDLHEFYRTEKFSYMCYSWLPGRLAEIHSGCVLLFLSLSRLHLMWLKNALVDARRERSPVLFRAKNNIDVQRVEPPPLVFRRWTCGISGPA